MSRLDEVRRPKALTSLPDRAVDQTMVDEVVESYLIQSWPAAYEDAVLVKATDTYAVQVRAQPADDTIVIDHEDSLDTQTGGESDILGRAGRGDCSRPAKAGLPPGFGAFLRRATAWFASQGVTVERVLTDNAWAYTKITWHRTCQQLGISPRRTRPWRPQTNGKVERFHRTLLDEWAYHRPYTSEAEWQAAFPDWLDWYKYQRPHTGISGQTPASREAAVARLLDHYVATAGAAVAYMEPRAGADDSGPFPGRDAALGRLDAEHPNLVAAALCPEARSHPAGVGLGIDLTPYLSYRRHFDDAIALSTRAAGIYHELRDHRGEGKALNNLGLMFWETGRFQEAIIAHRQDLAICEKAGDRHGRATALNHLGLALQGLRQYADAILAPTMAARIFEQAGDRRLEATALANLGSALGRVGRFEDAIAAHRKDLALCHQSGHRHSEGQALLALGLTLKAAGSLEDAGQAYGTAAAIFRETGDLRREAEARGNLGTVLACLGRLDEAVTALTEAAPLFRESGDPDDERRALTYASEVRERLDRRRPHTDG